MRVFFKSRLILHSNGIPLPPTTIEAKLCGHSSYEKLPRAASQMFQHLGEQLAANGIIKELNISNCAANPQNRNNPVEYFIESLVYPGSLTRLDISCNRIDFRGMQVLEACYVANAW